MGKNSKFTYGDPPAAKVTVTSHDGRQIEVEKQIVDSLGDAYKQRGQKPAPTVKKEG